MVPFLNALLKNKSPPVVFLVGLAFVALVGVVDLLLGFELSFSSFYLVPISMVAWFAPLWSGYLISIICAIVWLLVDYRSGHTYSHWFIPIWNAFVRLLFFLVTTYLLGEVKMRLNQERVLASIDGLTQVLNASAFKEQTAKVLQLAKRYHHPSVLGFIDLDNFKPINDQYGHSEGDRVLVAVAGTLARCVRSTDILGRMGGDEFAVYMPEVNEEDARLSFARIRDELLKTATDNHWPVGFSIGVAVFEQACDNIDQALKQADRLMYSVKQGGKNDIIFAGPASSTISSRISPPAA
jgi:diguanylate cyclase (GGDEF)-like protein